MNDWSDYPILLAVSETGSLTAAGEQLGISQPTVGRRIKALESRFGVPLLGKEEGKLVPTEFGFKVLDHIRRMETEADAITRSSATLETSLSGPIIIAASEGMGDWWLPSVMRLFQKDYPEIRIDLKLDFKAANLAQREADIAMRWMGPGTQNSLIGRKISEFGFGLYASEDYIARKGLPKSPEELLDHDGVEMDIGANPFWPTNHNGSILERPRSKFITNSLLAHQHAIMSDYGIGMLAHCSVHRGDDLVRILPDIERVEELWLVAHEDLRKSARVRAAFDFLADALLKDHNHFRYGTDSVFPHPHIHMHDEHVSEAGDLAHTTA
ncbi:MAG: LysR family transcriptional regulator [Acidimicrobiales bacterium]|nr:LysR family transcriptional regulator [Hyphomonadaceae bacterium]RZV41025.1 MAG: LysR family transcriptional regulator [Acidimicrobiales bacterium]